MGALLKRLRAYAGPVLLVYTILVTWFLISTAWSEHGLGESALDGSSSSRRSRRSDEQQQQHLVADRPGKSFLDIIVQEERRHMKSFKNAVRSYRDAFIEDNEGPNLKKTQQRFSNSDQMEKSHDAVGHSKRRYAGVKNNASKTRSGKRTFKSSSHVATEDQQLEATGDSKHSHDQYKNQNLINTGGSVVVEVEDWNQSRDLYSAKNYASPNEKKPKPNINSKARTKLTASVATAASLVDIEVDSRWKLRTTRPNQNKTSKLPGPDQFVKFCDQVFQDPNFVPNLCDRPRVEFSNKKHVPVSNATLAFWRIGELKVYSAFLDVREEEPSVRAMVLAPSAQGNGPSIYWCVFHNGNKSFSPVSFESLSVSQVESQNTEQNKAMDAVHPPKNVSSKTQTKAVLGATVMSFYAASDGHGRPNRFYIASCPVTQRAYSLFSHASTSASVQILVGSLETAFLGAVQESIVIDVIINKPIKIQTPLTDIQRVQKFGKTLLVDIKSPGVKNNVTILDNVVLDVRNSSKRYYNPNKRVISVFDLDDDDEDKEISREKKHHLIPGKIKSRPEGAFVIPLPQVDKIGETIVSCVAPLHGRVSAAQVIEFVELSLLLGVQHIVFYLPSSPGLTDARRAVWMYEARGLVTSLPWDLPAAGDGNQSHVADDVWARGRDVALNDCLYRTVHKFHWALFLDLDEFFVPRTTPDLPSFLRYLTAQHSFNASRLTDLVFPSAYFPPPSRAQYKNLTTTLGFHRDVNKFSSLKSVHRTYFDPKQTLRMLRPDAVARVGAGERKKTSFILSHRYASVHHYSFCPRSEQAAGGAGPKAQGGVSCNHLKLDWTVWRFKPLLLDRGRSAVTLLDKG